jgi:hypothetical protein
MCPPRNLLAFSQSYTYPTIFHATNVTMDDPMKQHQLMKDQQASINTNNMGAQL